VRKSKEGRSFAHRALGVEARRVPCMALARSVPWARCVPAVCRLFDARGAGVPGRRAAALEPRLYSRKKLEVFDLIRITVTAARAAPATVKSLLSTL